MDRRGRHQHAVARIALPAGAVREHFFRTEFNKVSRDIYLPDCFGFGFSLPSIAAHSGLKSFSTQKLTWGRPIPFPIGRWKGVDGSEILAELDPKSYTTRITTDMQTDPNWQNQFTPLGDGKSVEFRYFGTGDTGGGPNEESVQNYEKAFKEGSTIDIRNTSPDQLAHDLTPQQFASLPEYNSELILKTHGTGCYTSQAAMKTFNRQNELLANAAESSAVAAEWLAGQTYPTERLRAAWVRMLWHQFHDDLTGTCIPQAYQFSWNDELASLNQFAGVLTSSTSAVASLLDTERRRHPARRLQPGVDGAPRSGGGDGAFWRPGAGVGPRDRRGNGARRPRAGARHERQRRAHSFLGRRAVGRLRGVSCHRGRRGRAGGGGSLKVTTRRSRTTASR